jgi:DNA repair protein RadC
MPLPSFSGITIQVVTPNQVRLTKRLVEAGKLLGIQTLDHVIIGDGTESYFSFADEGQL